MQQRADDAWRIKLRETGVDLPLDMLKMERAMAATLQTREFPSLPMRRQMVKYLTSGCQITAEPLLMQTAQVPPSLCLQMMQR